MSTSPGPATGLSISSSPKTSGPPRIQLAAATFHREEVDGDVLCEGAAQIALRAHDAHHPAVSARCADALGQGVASHRVEHDVHALAIRFLLHHLNVVLRMVVDDAVRSE